MKGLAFSCSTLWGELNSTNLFEKVPEVQAPVYFIMGKHDRIAHDTVRTYTEALKAPYKQLIEFEASGHFACFEEPQRFQQLLIHEVAKRHAAES